MKRLILIRHAKSSWETALNDKDRPLANRGVQDAHLMAEKTQKLLPESYIIWSSTAKRALETARIFAQHLGYPEDLIVKKEGLDRKSTRLNSSHVRISYAVFCLKKKK